MEDAETVFYI